MRVRPFCTAVIALAIGCAAPEPNDAPTAAHPAAIVPPSATPPVEREVPLVPLNREALDARVHAQRSALGSDSALFEDERGRPVPWISPSAGTLPGDPSFDDELLDSLPGSSGLGSDVAYTGPRADGNKLGLFEPLDGNPLAHFHDALRALRAGRDPDGKVRVAIYGASHTEADVYPQYLRSYLQDRFGDGGHGFVMPAPPWRGYDHVDVTVEGFDHWRTEHAQRREARGDGFWGLLGASVATKNPRAFGRVVQSTAAPASRYELSFLAQPKGGSFELYVDGRRREVIATAADTIRNGYHAFELEEAPHLVEVRPLGDGEVRLLGLTMERSGAGVVVDTLGIAGTRAANALAWNEPLWQEALRRRAPDLVILAYGTNEATDAEQPIGDYEARLSATLSRYREAVPQASCLLVGPGDFPAAAPDGTLVPRPRVTEIIAVQERLAAQHGCAFWDLRAFMGGELAMAQWMLADPPMAQRDHIHLTRRGYVRMGMALADALMSAYDEPTAG